MSEGKTNAKPGSKFSGLLAAVHGRDEADGDEATESRPIAATSGPVATPERSQEMPGESNTSRRGRPRGKRSNPDFEQVTAYIRSRTHRDVKIALLREGDGREFSELIEELLTTWVKSRT